MNSFRTVTSSFRFHQIVPFTSECYLTLFQVATLSAIELANNVFTNSLVSLYHFCGYSSAMLRPLFGRPFLDDNVPPYSVGGALKLPTGAACTIGAGVGGGTGTISVEF